MLACGMQMTFAQEQPAKPIDPVVDQKQNINTMAWENTPMTMVQPTQVPPATANAFKTKYPNQAASTWYRTDNGYVVMYQDQSKMNQRVVYDANGNAVYMGKQIQGTSLPTPVSTYLKKTYPDMTSQEVYEVVTPAGVKSYQVMVNGKWMKFDDKGNLVPAK